MTHSITDCKARRGGRTALLQARTIALLRAGGRVIECVKGQAVEVTLGLDGGLLRTPLPSAYDGRRGMISIGDMPLYG